MNNIELNHPSEMSARARAAEITTILATTIVRTQLAQVEKQREVDLGYLPGQRVHKTPYQQEEL